MLAQSRYEYGATYSILSRMSRDRRNALAALTAAGLIWGLTVPLAKLSLGWLDPYWLNVARFGLAGALLGGAARRSLRAAISPLVLAWGAAFYGACLLLQNLGIALTSVSHAGLIFGSVPLLVAVAAVASGRGMASRASWVGFALGSVGIALIAGSGGSDSLAGDLLVLGSAAVSALYIVGQPQVLDGRDPVAVTAVQMLAGAVVTLPLALGVGTIPTIPAGGPLAAFAALAVVGSLLPFALYAYGQARVAPEVAGAFINLEPLVGVALGASLFGDPFGSIQALGSITVCAGILLSAEWVPWSRWAAAWRRVAV